MTNIPTRYSVRDDDYDPAIGNRLTIYLDSVEQAQVIAYDMQAGTVLRYVLDDDGDFTLNEAKEEVLEETWTGKVMVKLRSPEPNLAALLDDAPHERQGRDHPLPG